MSQRLQKQINESTWYFDAHNSFYLVVGTQKAALIDTSMGPASYLEELRQYTALPIEVLLTHGHCDHIGRSADFATVWLPQEDLPIYQEHCTYPDVFAKPVSQLHLFEGCPVFDLGGLTLQTLHISGHTPGSVCYLDPTHKIVFLGDSISTGWRQWLQMPYSPMIRDYLPVVEQFLSELMELGVDDRWQFYGGHWHQRYKYPYSRDNPVDLQTIRDLILLCRGLLNGSIHPVPSASQSFGAPAYEAHYGKALLVFTLRQLC